jgi:hypothetical protein
MKITDFHQRSICSVDVPIRRIISFSVKQSYKNVVLYLFIYLMQTSTEIVRQLIISLSTIKNIKFILTKIKTKLPGQQG